MLISADAQVYIFVRTDAPDVVREENVKDGYCRAIARMNAKGGVWEKLLETDVPGHDSVFTLYDKKRNPIPRYFLSYGKQTGTESITEARGSGRAQTDNWADVYWGIQFNNLNKFPLQKPLPNETDARCVLASAETVKKPNENTNAVKPAVKPDVKEEIKPAVKPAVTTERETTVEGRNG